MFNNFFIYTWRVKFQEIKCLGHHIKTHDRSVTVVLAKIENGESERRPV